MDDVEVFAKKKKKLETLIQTIKIYSQDTGMEFSIEKYIIHIMKKGKRETIKGTELPNLKSIKILGEKENYK